MHAWKLAVDTSSTHSDCQTVYCVVRRMTVLFCSANMLTVFRSVNIMWTSELTMWLQKKLLTLSQLKIMSFPLALFREYRRVISVRNFALKFQVIAQKTASNVRWYFFAAVAAPCSCALCSVHMAQFLHNSVTYFNRCLSFYTADKPDVVELSLFS